MGGLGNAATTLITTKGLFIGDGITNILEFGAGITPFFRLWIGPVKPNNYVAAAGSRVYETGTLKDRFFQPVDPVTGLRIGPKEPDPFGLVDETGKRIDGAESGHEPWLVVPRDKEREYFGEDVRDIIVKFVFNGTEHERIYTVREHNANRLIEVINFTNATRARVSATISRLKRITTRAIVEIRKLQLVRRRNK